MFITIEGININSDSIKDFTREENTIVITDTKDDRTIYFFSSIMEAKKEELRILKELNNAKNK